MLVKNVPTGLECNYELELKKIFENYAVDPDKERKRVERARAEGDLTAE